MAYVEVEIDLYDVETDDLLEEIRRRGYSVQGDGYRDFSNVGIELNDLYEAKKLNNLNFDKMFSDYIWKVLGKHL